MNPKWILTREKITLNDAILQTYNWRSFLQATLEVEDPTKLVRGVFISRADIEDLGNVCKSDDTIMGVRAYFALEQEAQKWPYVNVVKVVMVPVKEVPGYPNGQDQCIEAGGSTTVLDDSNVYDFTMPCPDCCDVTSDLYNGTPVKL